jgi:toxin FitB
VILLDTCLISETLKPHPDPGVLSWIDGLKENQVYIPALVIGELHKGVRLLPGGQKRRALEMWLGQLEERFARRILPVDGAVSIVWGRLAADLQKRGTSLPSVDLLLASLALHHNAVFATRNVIHFEPTGVSLVNPWEAEPQQQP